MLRSGIDGGRMYLTQLGDVYMLKSFEAKGLNGRLSFSCKFHSDLNVLTGKNGSGKTTILKTLWYLISGNLERIPQELSFKYIRLITTDFQLTMESIEEDKVTFNLVSAKGGTINDVCTIDQLREESGFVRRANQITGLARSSVFFPTFRRIEGGFSINSRGGGSSRTDWWATHSYTSGVEMALKELSDRLSVLGHSFVCSISTSDVVNLLTRRYADTSAQTNNEHARLIGAIIREIDVQNRSGSNRNRLESEHLSAAYKAIENIRRMTTEYRTKQERMLLPFETLSSFIRDVFAGRGITITDNIHLGGDRERIGSDLLSAGEKHILSFLVYNAFHDGIPIFIDEPEISLHVDWQRTLFPTLLSQKTKNQFIIATHSPFIYAKYADKEVLLERTRGS